MNGKLLSVEEAAASISRGRRLWLAGDEGALKKLPRGSWVGGTISYFMAQQGGCSSRTHVFVTELPDYMDQARTQLYGVEDLPRMTSDAFDYGVSFIIIPAGSEVHLRFAKDAPTYRGAMLKPLVGWIAGVALDDIGKIGAKVFDGETGEASDSKAVVMHVAIPRSKVVSLDIINLFKQGSGDDLVFEQTGFSAEECLVNGKRTPFAAYLLERKVDTRLPLVADYSGAMINTSFQSVDAAKGVKFYAPVFAGMHYKIAAPVEDYATEFRRIVAPRSRPPLFSCNCILNYLYGELEGKRTEGFVGPITFGEIAYQLVNQTLVYLDVRDA